MRRLIAVLIALVLAGCVGSDLPTQTPYIVTATPPVATPDPTPTLEELAPPEELWYSGCDVNPHCDSDAELIPVNENSSLVMGTAQSETVCVLIHDAGLPYQRCRVVDTPAPYGLYRWYFADATAIDGTYEFPSASPETSEVGNGYTVNVSGMRGFMALDLVHQSVYAGLGRYVVGMEFDSIDLHTYNPDVVLNEAINKQCFVMLDSGYTIPLEPQAWAGNDNESVVYIIQLSSPHTFLLRCGIYINHAVVDGQILFTRFFVAPVGPEYGEGHEGVIEIP